MVRIKDHGTKRSRRKIFGTVVNYILKSESPFSKSQLKDIGLNPNMAENYIKCIEIVQKSPIIIVYKTGTRTIIGKKLYPDKKIENKWKLKDRSMIEVFQSVSEFITNAVGPFYISALKNIGLDSITALKYIECFEMAQKLQKLYVLRTNNGTIVGFN